MKRLEWLKARAPQPTPPPVRRASFRTSESRAVSLRAPVSQPAEEPPPAPRSAEKLSPPAPETQATAARLRDAQAAESRDSAAKRSKSRTVEAPAPTPRVSSTPAPQVAATRSPATPAPKATPARSSLAAVTKTSPKKTVPEPTPEPAPVEIKTTVARSTPPFRANTAAGSRYPWKTGIVTTVFWVGEPAGGNNFTPNVSSSWDANWTQSYGGYDNPNPDFRRRFIPIKFTPRQNPFYIALPYNDVTRGTTKPEARVIIPWFKEAFRREGESVCRNRWVAVRNRAGRVGYAQWSDCGPFRTDHWQYVFGKEKPKPNLNQGAGLDVSPALRDYLGLQSTDVTDWKFVEYRDVPSGPWCLHGENNPFTQKGSQPSKRAARTEAPSSTGALARNP